MRILLVVPDNGSRTHWYPLGIVSVANALHSAGNDVSIWHQDMTHEPDEHLASELRAFGAESCGIGWIAGKVSHTKGMNLARIARQHVKHLVLGGHGPSSAPQWHLDATKADAVVVGEGEGVCGSWGALRGVVQGSSWHHRWLPPTDCRQTWIAAEHYYPLVRAPGSVEMDRVAPVLSGFGCPHHCSFCFRLPGQGHRLRDVRDIISQVEWLRDCHRITYIQFQDELLMTSPKRVRAICEAIGPMGVRWSCQGRVNVAARDPSILATMHEAGCVFVNYGIESTSQRVLDLMGKRQTVEQSIAAVEATLAAGISPGLNMLWGCPGDDEESLWGNVAFLERYDDHCQRRTIRPVTPYPGSRLYNEAVATGLIRDAGHFYSMLVNSDLITVDFMGLPRTRAHELLLEANLRLLRAHQRAADDAIEGQARALYLDGDGEFRGWR